MGLEIERKYLIDQYEFYNECVNSKTKSCLIEQGYLTSSKDGQTVRVRIVDNEEAILCIKIKINASMCHEFEYPIPVRDAQTMLGNVLTIRKRRYDLGNGLTVDEFLADLAGLYLCEKEFTHEDEIAVYEPPKWCNEDVTDSGKYANAKLVNQKYLDGELVGLHYEVPKRQGSQCTGM